MKIALVHEMLVKLGGAERVLKKLGEIYPEAPIYTLINDRKISEEWLKGRDILDAGLPGWLPRQFLLPQMSRAVEAWDFSGFDAVISSSSAFAHGIRTPAGVKHICYCHSPMRYAWDFTHEYTQKYSGWMRWMIAKTLHSVRQWDFRAAKRPDVILANSKHTQKRVAKYWRRDSEVLYPPVNVRCFTPRRANDDFFLIVSALTPFKRIDLAVRAFNQNRRKLVVIGEGAQQKQLESMANDNIRFLGRQPDELVKDYFERCRAFVFPGEEDFGITPVEAMAAGKPVLAYGVGGVTESVVAGVSGEFFDQPTVEYFNSGLERLLQNETHYDPQKIRTIAEQFDEEIFEKKIKSIISSFSLGQS